MAGSSFLVQSADTFVREKYREEQIGLWEWWWKSEASQNIHAVDDSWGLYIVQECTLYKNINMFSGWGKTWEALLALLILGKHTWEQNRRPRNTRYNPHLLAPRGEVLQISNSRNMHTWIQICIWLGPSQTDRCSVNLKIWNKIANCDKMFLKVSK